MMMMMTDEGAVNWLEQTLLRETYKLKRVEIPVFLLVIRASRPLKLCFLQFSDVFIWMLLGLGDPKDFELW